MEFELVHSANLGLRPNAAWLWYSLQSRSFILGDDQRAFAVPVANPAEPTPLTAARTFPRDVPIQGAGGVPTIADHRRAYSHPFNLPIPDSLYDELAEQPRGGLYFLPRSDYHQIPPDDPAWLGSVLGALCLGQGGVYMLHRPSKVILNLLPGSMQLLEPSPSGFTILDQTKTRGRQAMAFAAHPSERLLVYIDNYGSSFAHEFSTSKFGKARKIDDWQQGGRAAALIDAGRTLVLGGMGHLAAYRYEEKKFLKLHDVSKAVRGLTWMEEQQVLIVNQGLHGVSLYRVEDWGFEPCGAIKHDDATQQVAASSDLSYLATTGQHSAELRIHAKTQN